MPSLSYKDQFATKVRTGEKSQTIRATRKVPIKQGDILYHFTRMRRPDCERLGYSIAEEVLAIDIFAQVGVTGPGVFLATGSAPDSGQRRLGHSEVRALAKADGFDNMLEFYAWFVGGNKDHFTGHLIKWPTTWSPATCPKCGDNVADHKGRTLWCSSCNHNWKIGATS